MCKKTTLNQNDFRALLCNLHNTHQPHTFDYMGETSTFLVTTITENEEGHLIYQFDSFKELYANILENLSTLDLTQGGDDQFFDYNPAILESIIYGLYILQSAENLGIFPAAYDALKRKFDHYWELRKTEEIDVDDNDSIYEYYQDSIDFDHYKIKSINNLEVTQYFD